MVCKKAMVVARVLVKVCPEKIWITTYNEYLQEGTTQPAKRKHDFIQMEKPLDVINLVDR